MKKFMMLIAFVGFIFLVGAAGGYDKEAFTFAETIVKCVLGGAMMAAGVLGLRAVDVLRKRKAVNERYQRIRTICDYEANQLRRTV